MKVMELGTTELKQEAVRIDGKVYLLQEANGGKVIEFRTRAMSCAKMTDGKVTGIKGDMATLEPWLLSQCLYETEPDGEGFKIKYVHNTTRPVCVPQGTILGWPERIQKTLFKTLKGMSGMDQLTNPKELETEIKRLQEQLEEMKTKDAEDPKE